METRTNTELWQRLSEFEFDDPDADLPFSKTIDCQATMESKVHGSSGR